MTTRTENILNLLGGVKASGASAWQALCPSHDDKSPSLSIKETNDGTMLLRCWAGCSATDIVSAMGLQLSDLFPKVDRNLYVNASSRALTKARQRERSIEQDRAYSASASLAASIHPTATVDASQHAYIVRKGIKTFGVNQNRDDVLVIPIYDARNGKLQTIQFIGGDGQKRFLSGGRTAYGCFPLRHTPESFKRAMAVRIGVGEGYATTASLAHVLGDSVAMFSAFSASNLVHVAVALRERCADAEITIYGDNDVNQVGQNAATKAALAVNGFVALPETTGTDWSDALRAAA